MGKMKKHQQEYEASYPEYVEINNQKYKVTVDTGSDGMINYFNLYSLDDEFFFEADWVTSDITEEEIKEIITMYN